MKNKFLLASLVLLLLGVLFLFLENTFFQYVDQGGVLQESWLFPLGVLSIIVGFLLLIIFALKSFYTFLQKKNNQK